MKQLTKKQITSDELEGTRNIPQGHGGATSEFKGIKSGFKGKSTPSLLVPNQENFVLTKIIQQEESSIWHNNYGEKRFW